MILVTHQCQLELNRFLHYIISSTLNINIHGIISHILSF